MRVNGDGGFAQEVRSAGSTTYIVASAVLSPVPARSTGRGGSIYELVMDTDVAAIAIASVVVEGDVIVASFAL